MKTAIVISDTHGNIGAIEKITLLIKENDYLFHLGDFNKDILVFNHEFGSKIHAVLGNCDGGGEDIVLEIEGVKILLTHGDRYGVKQGLMRLKLRAEELGATAVFYGHTHQPKIDNDNGIIFVNPGCMTFYGAKSYAYAVFHQGKAIVKLVPIYD